MTQDTDWPAFERFRVATDHGDVLVRTAGSGPPLLLLHGFPQTGHCYRKIAPGLARDYRVIVPDLPGYGASAGPAAAADGTPYDKRALARSIASLMDALNAPRFLLAGHDRGARVAYRLALDMPERVAALASLDTVPTLSVWEAADYRAALKMFHWMFLAQPAGFAVPVLQASAEIFIAHLLDEWARHPLDAEARGRYIAAYGRPEVCAGACADYRAGAGPDLALDRADREAGRKLACPLLVPYGVHYTGHTPPDAAWRVFADDIRSLPVDCGHFLAEEAPEQTLSALTGFFSAARI